VTNLDLSRGESLALVGLAAILAVLALAAFLWRRFVGPTAVGSPLRIAKNSLFPIGASMFNRLLDLLFFAVLIVALGPSDLGLYTGAVVLVGYFDVVIPFGLHTLLVREVARVPTSVGRLFWNALSLRLGLWCVGSAVLYLITDPFADALGLTAASSTALRIFYLALLPGQVSNISTAVLLAHERNEIPATIAIATNLARIGLGLYMLSLGAGFVGLAGVSLVVNVMTMATLVAITVRLFGVPRWSWDPRFSWWMARESYPLMLNGVLNSIFFRIDVVLLQALGGPLSVGYYSTAYRFIDGLGTISSSFVLAVFPLMSRQHAESKERLRTTVSISLRVLLAIALPLCIGTMFLAEQLVQLVARDRSHEYLPHAAIALMILIWFLPLSFVNGLFQYVLIAGGRQKRVTVAFVLAASFNVVANLLFIPRYDYLAAAVTTVLSEVVLLAPFAYGLAQQGVLPPLRSAAWRPLLAALAMGAVLYPLGFLGLLSIPLGGAVYLATLALLGAVGPEERRVFRSMRNQRSAT
jgi:O-antigen/teichoic acid export membrane protein